jgi:hypothetical protein
MTAQDAIDALDRQLAQVGTPIMIRRAAGTVIERPHVAFPRGYKPNELVGGLQQGDTLLVISPTDMPREFASEADMIRRGDKIRLTGRIRNVEFVEPVLIGETLVRLNVTVRG